jgi:hypothetical protein
MPEILGKTGVSHNVYLRFFTSKNTITCGDLACVADMLWVGLKRGG